MPEIPQAKLFELVLSMFDAAQKASPDAWDDVYAAIAETFDSGPGGFVAYDSQKDEFRLMAGAPDDQVSLSYLERFQFDSPFRKYVLDLNAGERFNREDHMSDDQFRMTDIYHDSFAPAKVFHIEYRVFRAYREIRRGLLLTRAEGQRNFDASELQALTFLTGYLEKAFGIYVTLVEAKRENRLMAEALDCFSHGVLVVDRNEKLIFASTSGKEFIGHGNGFQMDRSGKLHASTTDDAGRFRRILGGLFNGAENGNAGGSAMQVSRGDGLRPLEVLISRCLESNGGDNYNEPLAIVFVSDPEQQYEPAIPVLMCLYGLTDAEARIAGLLTNGRSLGEICETLGIQQNTVRTHLKHIFSKTDTNRQADLIKLILNGPANLKVHDRS